jgi:hypothetical protein
VGGNVSGGQIGGAIVGAVVGTIIGAGPGVGTIYGASIGYSLGGLIDPPAVEIADPAQPEAEDIRGPTFQYNVPVPIVYGTSVVTGNVIFIGKSSSELVKVGEQEVAAGGKDGTTSQDVLSRWYTIDFALGLAEGQCQSVDYVFKNQKDITDEEGNLFSTYLGTPTQSVPSQVSDAILEFGDIPWRNTAYIMWHGTLGPVNALPLMEVWLTGIDTAIEETATNELVL